MKYTRVRRAVSAVVIDSWDEDRNPEHIKVNGNVTFRPLLNDGDVVQWAGPNGPESLVLAPIQCRISDGIIMHRGGRVCISLLVVRAASLTLSSGKQNSAVCRRAVGLSS